MTASFTVLENIGGPTVFVSFDVNGTVFRYETPKAGLWQDMVRAAQQFLIADFQAKVTLDQLSLTEVLSLDPSK